jgi:hypothetical protein
MDERGKWLPKSRKVYDLDENGERIKLPSGNWKCHKENIVDWNEQYHGEEWRHGWEIIQNRYLEMTGSQERVDLRSYERQGLDIIPTVHLGPAVTQMERRGIQTNIGSLNRDIRAANRMMNTIRKTIESLHKWISDLLEVGKGIFAEQEVLKSSPNLVNLLLDYIELRKAERSNWSVYGQQKGNTDDLKSVSNAMLYLQDHNLSTLEDLNLALIRVNTNAKEINIAMKKAEKRMQIISGIQSAVCDCQTYQAVHDKYIRIGWKTRQAVFAENHKHELESYNKAFRYLKKHGYDLNADLNALEKEHEDLSSLHDKKVIELAAVKAELLPMREIRYWIDKVLSQNETEIKSKPEPKHSIKDQMNFLQDQRQHTSDPKVTNTKKQYKEL